MRGWYLFILGLFALSELAAQTKDSDFSGLKIGKNYRIYPSNIAQTEVFLVKSPLDQNILFAGCNTINFLPFFISEGIYTTTNGGASWRGPGDYD
jgi:hypothetical protein